MPLSMKNYSGINVKNVIKVSTAGMHFKYMRKVFTRELHILVHFAEVFSPDLVIYTNIRKSTIRAFKFECSNIIQKFVSAKKMLLLHFSK